MHRKKWKIIWKMEEASLVKNSLASILLIDFGDEELCKENVVGCCVGGVVCRVRLC